MTDKKGFVLGKSAGRLAVVFMGMGLFACGNGGNNAKAYPNWDKSFASDGVAITDVSGSFDAVISLVVDSDDSIYAIGGDYGIAAVARLDQDGSFDQNYGVLGTFSSSPEHHAAFINHGLMDASGKIVAVGTGGSESWDDMLLLRLDEGGQLDASFGENGLVFISPTLASHETAFSCSLSPVTGMLVAAGTCGENREQGDFCIAEVNDHGVQNLAFGDGGFVYIDFNGGHDVAFSVKALLNGQNLVGGSAYNGNDMDYAVARLTSTGSLDSTFGTGGKVLVDFGNGDDFAYSMVVLADGKILLAGFTQASQDGIGNLSILRLNSDGSLDNTFGQSGVVILDLVTAYPIFLADTRKALDMTIDTNGRILLTGNIHLPDKPTQRLGLGVFRLTGDGNLEHSFGEDSYAQADLIGSAHAVALQSNDRIIVGGSDVDPRDMAIVRFLP